MKIKGLTDFAWSPTDDIISYWTPEHKDVPARVTVIELPSRKSLCIKNLFTVADCKMHWQKCGDYLCVKVDRYKSKREERDGQVKFGVSIIVVITLAVYGTGTATGTRTMGDNRCRPLSLFRCTVKGST